MKGSTYKRCACKRDDGRQFGKACPKLKSTRHGSWYYATRIPGHPHPVKKGGFRTQFAAEAALRALQAKVGTGHDLAAGQQTVVDYLEQWLAGKADLKDSTRSSYAAHVRLYLAPALGPIKLDELRDWHVEEMYAAMRLLGHRVKRPSPLLRRLLAAREQVIADDRPLSPARLRRVHATLMSALNSAVKRRRLTHNPAKYVELESGKAPKAVVWTPARVETWQQTGKRLPGRGMDPETGRRIPGRRG